MEFLHRTVRDFLQDSYYTQLRKNRKSNFVSTVSLCKMSLVLLKAQPANDFSDFNFQNASIALTDQLIYYAYETEKRDEASEFPLATVLDELDRVNTHFASRMKKHWTHARDPAEPLGLDVYKEGGNCNFLALMVQARLTKYVRAKLEANPRHIQKRGRPLLYYALRPRRRTPITMKYHTLRDDPSVEVDMVKLLLEYGADANQPVYLNDGKTVWALFLLSIHEAAARNESATGRLGILPSLRNAWYDACVLLIEHGARQDCILVRDRPEVTIKFIYEGAFGAERSNALQRLMEEKARKMQSQKVSCILM